MATYQIKFYGNAGIIPLEIEKTYTNDVWALKDVERTLGHYYPVYYKAGIWKLEEDGNSKLLGYYNAKIEIVREEIK